MLTLECKDNCDVCDGENMKARQDRTDVSKLVVKALTIILAMQKKVTVQLISLFLLESKAAEIKALSLDLVDGYGSAKSYFKKIKKSNYKELFIT